ncbi:MULTISPECIES: hypothetical protein [Salipiger]|jgi:hypothetical protein|uniref:Holin n=1 Tax=Salipiger profundus TaxID=1229727 RepID=A0A1U7DB09_9RHOB|nr:MULTISPECIES: hypothetical protein [Salipiger]APX25298.1 hypothetical protein Ga0080559_TMP4502 [Salipiger profundus]GGA30282.1 hypothetical protein GCM10011326_47740 [Salipiger profundus]SFE02565.1 hypothetical protein SAMN05444415_1561 [Salipiger profundus]|tara:strand:+ start:55 stop:372 length:318 start_codon:yes stop_codon:yes gene_type:complete
MKHLTTWLGENVWMLAAVIGGILVSILTSEEQTFRMAVVRVCSGLFFATLFPGPVLDVLGRDPAIYGNAVAGLLAMTGYAIAKSLAGLTGRQLAEWVAIVIGRKK